MSRIGKQPIVIPSDIKVTVDGANITFTKGKNSRTLDTQGNVACEVKDNNLIISTLSNEKQHKAFWGTYRALANNVIVGLTKGFEKKLEINGVGYRAAVKGKTLELQLGFSHPINFPIPEGISISVEKNLITVKGIDNQQVGQVSADIRAFRPPEPYKGKGVKYLEERIIRKAGKTAKK
jgi:large subunit ribosomal protein L6